MAYSIKDSFLLSAALTAHSMQVASSFFTKERIVSCIYPPTTPTVTRCIPLSVGSEPWQVHVRRIVIRTPHPAVFFTSFCIPTPENVSPYSWLKFGYVRGIETVSTQYLYPQHRTCKLPLHHGPSPDLCSQGFTELGTQVNA